MFRGRFEHSLDAKGRLQLPAAFKKTLAKEQDEHLIITTHISSPCLVAYTKREWEVFEKKVARLPQFEPSVMTLRRLYVGSAMDAPIDRQGRVLIPPMLRDYAKLEKESVWVGGMRTMEIWSKKSWESIVEASRQRVGSDVLSKLGELGL